MYTKKGARGNESERKEDRWTEREREEESCR